MITTISISMSVKPDSLRAMQDMRWRRRMATVRYRQLRPFPRYPFEASDGFGAKRVKVASSWEGPTAELAAEAGAGWRATELRRSYETLAREHASTSGWRRLVTRESVRHLERALAMLDQALELQTEVSRRTIELDAELARSRMRE